MMMDGSFDIYTLLFLVLAVVIFWRLRSVLGRRTGNERPPYDPYSREAKQNGAHAPGGDKVVPLPRGAQEAGAGTRSSEAEDLKRRIGKFAPEGSSVAEGLMEIARADPNFDPESFIKGAKTAYEMIVTAFAEGNRKVLKPLLGRDVYEGFATAIAAREKRGETVQSQFVGIDKADIIEAALKNKCAQITVKFVSELITAVHNKAGEVIEGDDKSIREVTDIWTFAREVTSRDPNWKLIATQAAN